MPSDAAGPFLARCYCGASRLSLRDAPHVVTYCHCADCRRWTGAPVAAFAAYDRAAVTPQLGAGRTFGAVERWSCETCGSPLAAAFPYLPDQIYVPLGLFEDAAALPPALHSHADSALPWLHIADTLPRNAGSARDRLNACG